MAPAATRRRCLRSLGERPINELILLANVSLADPPHLPCFPMCMPLNPATIRCAAPKSRKPCLAFTRRDCAMILFQDVVQVSDRSMAAASALDRHPLFGRTARA